MAGTTSKGWPYVVASDNVADYPTTSLALANKAEAAVPHAWNQGLVSLVITSAASGTVAVTFAASRFSQVPQVVTSINTTITAWFSLTSTATTTGVTLIACQRDGTAASATLPMSWMACQMLPGAGPGLLDATGLTPGEQLRAQLRELYGDKPLVVVEYVATCETDGCDNAGEAVPMAYLEESPAGEPGRPDRVVCGVCSREITNLSGGGF